MIGNEDSSYKSQTKKLKTPPPLQENFDLKVVERCRICQGSVIMYRSGSCTLISVNAIGLDTGIDGVLV